MNRPQLEFITSLPLRHAGDCSLLGITPDSMIYVEEIYGDGWLAQHALGPDGTYHATVDEDSGANRDLEPLALPAHLARTQPGWHTARLNFSGPRHRGLREPERIADMVQPLAVQDKIRLSETFELPYPPPRLLGLAESYVLSEAALAYPDVFVVCRRLRIAYSLPEVERDAGGQPYDYDTAVVYLAHVFDRQREFGGPLFEPDDGLPGVSLRRPMDCVICAGRLYVAEGGAGESVSQVHVWRVESLPPPDSADWMQRLYGR